MGEPATNIQCFLLRKHKGTQIRNCCLQRPMNRKTMNLNYPKRSIDRSKSNGFILYFQESEHEQAINTVHDKHKLRILILGSKRNFPKRTQH